jgi:hypothetical protein
VHFVGVYFVIILQCAVQNIKNTSKCVKEFVLTNCEKMKLKCFVLNEIHKVAIVFTFRRIFFRLQLRIVAKTILNAQLRLLPSGISDYTV